MHFELNDEQNMIVDTVRSFLEKEIYPYDGEQKANWITQFELLQCEESQLETGQIE